MNLLMKILLRLLTASALVLANSHAFADEANSAKKADSEASALDFSLKNQDGKLIKLSDRKGVGYTVVYFYPKADTPGCTKQACAFRDSISVIRKQGAEVYGVSVNTVEEQKAFHTKNNLNFDLLADADGAVTKLFKVESKIPLIKMARRDTFILDENLKVRRHFENVDPALDAKTVAAAIEELRKQVN